MKTPPGDRFDNPTGIQITITNNTSKQQADAAFSLRSGKEQEAVEILRDEGFDQATAQRLAERYGIERIIRKRTAEHVFAWLEGAGKVGPWNMTM
jgi:hypothetical protein